MISLQSSVKRQDCKVCFNVFDSNDRRPRSLLCGHTICSKCISDNLKESKLVCPSCRREHQATNFTDFPVNYELESVLDDVTSGQPSLSKTLSSPSDVSRGISKKLKCFRQELSSGMEIISTSSQEASSQLHQYKSQMNEWKEQHQALMEEFSAIVCQHEEIIKHIEKESLRVEEAIKEGEEERQRVKVAEGNLAAASTAHDVFPALEEADHCYDNLDNWTHRVQGHFPDTELKTHSVKLKERAISALSVPEKEEERKGNGFLLKLMFILPLLLFLCLNLATSLSKIQQNNEDTILQEWFRVQYFNMTPLVRGIMESGRVYAVQENQEGGKRWAKITSCQNRLCLHVLSNKRSLPDDAIFLQHSDVMRLVDPSSRLTFLELGVDGSTLGRIYLRLAPDTLRAQHFTYLCTGEMGPSYANTNILEVSDKGKDEVVVFGDYERNDGSGGKALVQRLTDEMGGVYRRSWLAGTLCRGWRNRDEIGAQFSITTANDRNYVWDRCFGIVEDGLHVLTKAILHYPNIRDVSIQDCGIVLKS